VFVFIVFVFQKWPMRSRLYIGATGQFLGNSNENQGASSSSSQT